MTYFSKIQIEVFEELTFLDLTGFCDVIRIKIERARTILILQLTLSIKELPLGDTLRRMVKIV